MQHYFAVYTHPNVSSRIPCCKVDALHLNRRHDYKVANKTFLPNIDINKMFNNSMIHMAEFKFHTYVEK